MAGWKKGTVVSHLVFVLLNTSWSNHLELNYLSAQPAHLPDAYALTYIGQPSYMS